MRSYNVAIVGATGMVGTKFLQVLSERNLPVKNYYLYASKRSAGKVVNFLGKDHIIIELKEENIVGKDLDFALFSAGGATSKEFAPIFVKMDAWLLTTPANGEQTLKSPLLCPKSTLQTARTKAL